MRILISRLAGLRIVRYSAVGLVGLSIDLLIFNLLARTIWYDEVEFFPLFVRAVSALSSMVLVFFLNQSFTFAETNFRFNRLGRVSLYSSSQLIGFFLVVLPFALTRYVAGIESLLVDNIMAGVVGPSLAFIFRYWFSVRFTFS